MNSIPMRKRGLSDDDEHETHWLKHTVEHNDQTIPHHTEYGFDQALYDMYPYEFSGFPRFQPHDQVPQIITASDPYQAELPVGTHQIHQVKDTNSDEYSTVRLASDYPVSLSSPSDLQVESVLSHQFENMDLQHQNPERESFSSFFSRDHPMFPALGKDEVPANLISNVPQDTVKAATNPLIHRSRKGKEIVPEIGIDTSRGKVMKWKHVGRRYRQLLAETEQIPEERKKEFYARQAIGCQAAEIVKERDAAAVLLKLHTEEDGDSGRSSSEDQKTFKTRKRPPGKTHLFKTGQLQGQELNTYLENREIFGSGRPKTEEYFIPFIPGFNTRAPREVTKLARNMMNEHKTLSIDEQVEILRDSYVQCGRSPPEGKTLLPSAKWIYYTRSKMPTRKGKVGSRYSQSSHIQTSQAGNSAYRTRRKEKCTSTSSSSFE